MSRFQTDEILDCWHSRLSERLQGRLRRLDREYRYLDKPLPFSALNMGKKDDEYFLDAQDHRIRVDELLLNLDLLHLKEFRTPGDLSSVHKQARKATSIVDIFAESGAAEIIIELEVFKDKPFSNLIFVPEIWGGDESRKRLFFLHCFAPERRDKEAELTRKIGTWLQRHPANKRYEYQACIMPPLPLDIKYLLPSKKAKKPESYQSVDHRSTFREYALAFCDREILPTIQKILGPFSACS
jgi:hypothetical protein